MIISIYQRMLAAGVQIDSHESDLYVPATEQTRKLIADYNQEVKQGFRLETRTFTSQIDGKPWIDIFFAYEPWWIARSASKDSPT